MYGGEGNITSTPLFANPWALDFRLLPGSPGIDEGTSVGVTLDFLGNSRPLDGDGLGAGSTGDGLDFDIGPYETINQLATLQNYILGRQTTTDTLNIIDSPWPDEWPEEWIAELQSIELPTTAVAMLTSYALQTGDVTTTTALDANADGRLDVADIVLAITGQTSSTATQKGSLAPDSRSAGRGDCPQSPAPRTVGFQRAADTDVTDSSTDVMDSSMDIMDSSMDGADRIGPADRSADVAAQRYPTRWRPPTAKPMPPRRPFPMESYRARYGKYAEAMWKLDNTPHPGNGPIIIDLREYE
ncbi:hypothetical protein JXA32_12320 [Candidatus Sumerlaeota bacterium]|nr:hypothetical protein [Candidatus Sumerlaeota bacterium]